MVGYRHARLRQPPRNTTDVSIARGTSDEEVVEPRNRGSVEPAGHEPLPE